MSLEAALAAHGEILNQVVAVNERLIVALEAAEKGRDAALAAARALGTDATKATRGSKKADAAPETAATPPVAETPAAAAVVHPTEEAIQQKVAAFLADEETRMARRDQVIALFAKHGAETATDNPKTGKKGVKPEDRAAVMAELDRLAAPQAAPADDLM